MSWELKKLDDCLELITYGFTNPMPDTDTGPWKVTAKDVVNGRIDFSTARHTSEEAFENELTDKSRPIKDDILLTKDGTLGRLAIVHDEKICINQSVALLRVNKDILLPKYLYYLLLTPEYQGKMLADAGGATIKHIYITRVNQLMIPVPAMSVQKRIVDIISAYDVCIDNNDKQIKLLEEAAQRLYKEWFVDLHFPGYENTSIVDGVPNGWTSVTLNDVISKITTGLNPRKNFVLGNGKNYYVTIKNMGDNNIYLDEKCDKVDDEAIIKINKRSDLQIGDILFSGIGTMGRVYLIHIPTDNWNVSESVFTMRANEKISKEFLYLMLLSPKVQGYCDTHAHGVAQRGIRMADLKEYPFNLPSKDIIVSFTDKVKPLIEKVQTLQKMNVILTEARDRLLPKLMSGEIEV